MTPLAVGLDVFTPRRVLIPPRGKELVYLDIAVTPPRGHYLRIASKSGNAAKKSIEIGAGVVDPDCTGNIGVILYNHSDDFVEFIQHDRIAQIVCEKFTYVHPVSVDSLTNTVRGESGFGST